MFCYACTSPTDCCTYYHNEFQLAFFFATPAPSMPTRYKYKYCVRIRPPPHAYSTYPRYLYCVRIRIERARCWFYSMASTRLLRGKRQWDFGGGGRRWKSSGRARYGGVVADLVGNTHCGKLVFQRAVFHEKDGWCFILARSERAYGRGLIQHNSWSGIEESCKRSRIGGRSEAETLVKAHNQTSCRIARSQSAPSSRSAVSVHQRWVQKTALQFEQHKRTNIRPATRTRSTITVSTYIIWV